jgi:hypothetical protein
MNSQRIIAEMDALIRQNRDQEYMNLGGLLITTAIMIFWISVFRSVLELPFNSYFSIYTRIFLIIIPICNISAWSWWIFFPKKFQSYKINNLSEFDDRFVDDEDYYLSRKIEALNYSLTVKKIKSRYLNIFIAFQMIGISLSYIVLIF